MDNATKELLTNNPTNATAHHIYSYELQRIDSGKTIAKGYTRDVLADHIAGIYDTWADAMAKNGAEPTWEAFTRNRRIVMVCATVLEGDANTAQFDPTRNH